VMKVDFWDTTELANKIVNVLKRPILGKTMSERTSFEVRKLTWADAAAACEKVYDEAVELVP
jgi:glycogen(starch) synthase